MENHKVRQEIAKNLTYYRKLKQWTQEELGAKIGVKRNTISSWEKAINAIDVDALFLLCQTLDISISDLFGVYANLPAQQSNDYMQALFSDYQSLPNDGKRMIQAVMETYLPYGKDGPPK